MDISLELILNVTFSQIVTLDNIAQIKVIKMLDNGKRIHYITINNYGGDDMKGCRPFTDTEVADIAKSLSLRDKAWFITGCMTGFRISELLSLKVKDVYQNGKIVNAISVARQNMKKKTEGRTQTLHTEAKKALAAWVMQLRTQGRLEPNDFLFSSRKSGAISRIQAHRILDEAIESNGLTGKVGTHSMRKYFAAKMYELLNHDLVEVKKAMGHKSVDSTISYLSFNQEKIDDAIHTINLAL